LLGIIAPFKDGKSKKGKISEKLEELNKEVKKFLEIYDENGDNEVGVEELINKRNKLIDDLSKIGTTSQPTEDPKLTNPGIPDLATSDKGTQQTQEIDKGTSNL
jgi:hypothetical protein